VPSVTVDVTRAKYAKLHGAVRSRKTMVRRPNGSAVHRGRQTCKMPWASNQRRRREAASFFARDRALSAYVDLKEDWVVET
jgi:hypothetical protein